MKSDEAKTAGKVIELGMMVVQQKERIDCLTDELSGARLREKRWFALLKKLLPDVPRSVLDKFLEEKID